MPGMPAVVAVDHQDVVPDRFADLDHAHEAATRFGLSSMKRGQRLGTGYATC